MYIFKKSNSYLYATITTLHLDKIIIKMRTKLDIDFDMKT